MMKIALTLILCTVLLSSCAMKQVSPELKMTRTLRIETCMAALTPIDPGPIDGIDDARLQQAMIEFVAHFAKDDLMAMNRDPHGREVAEAAFRWLAFTCWREGKLPPGDPVAAVDPASRGYK